jgi:hypothetical protein
MMCLDFFPKTQNGDAFTIFHLQIAQMGYLVKFTWYPLQICEKIVKLKHVGKHSIIIGKWWLFMNTLRKQFLKLCNFLCQLIQIDTMHSIEQFLNLFCRRSFLTSTKVLPNLWLRFTLTRQSYLLQRLRNS